MSNNLSTSSIDKTVGSFLICFGKSIASVIFSVTCFSLIRNLWNDEGAEDSITYTLSDLAALDIYNIYQKDSEYAFHLLSEINP